MLYANSKLSRRGGGRPGHITTKEAKRRPQKVGGPNAEMLDYYTDRRRVYTHTRERERERERREGVT